MKKLDKLILKSFIGPFLLTFVVVVFILLTQYMMKYFEEFVGKNLGFNVFAELIMYFSINMTPVALPLAVLLSSLMTFGNLGEHFELTAIKGAGISLVRALLPIFVFVILITIAAFFSNNYIVPKANLKAYSLLYDIKQTKPSLDLKEGAFYNGIPNYSIKVDKKFPDGVTLGNLIIYDHSAGMGNTKVILADSGKMYTFNNDNYLMLDLFNGFSYSEMKSNRRGGRNEISDFYRNSFDESKLVFSLASFGLKETKEELFANNRLMRNVAQLNYDIDSMYNDLYEVKYALYKGVNRYFSYHLRDEIEIPDKYIPKKIVDVEAQIRDSIRDRYNSNYTPANKKETKHESLKDPEPGLINNSKAILADSLRIKKQDNTGPEKLKKPQPKVLEKSGTIALKKETEPKTTAEKNIIAENKELKLKELKKLDSLQAIADSTRLATLDSVLNEDNITKNILNQASNQARYVKNSMLANTNKVKILNKEISAYIIEKNKKYSQAIACLVMFLIGAPLGAIIKRGGLGIPVIISIVFFIIYYVLTITGEKWGKEGLIDPVIAVWAANIILLPFGLIFLKQARNDARIFESDFYRVFFDKVRKRLGEKTAEAEQQL